MLKKVILMKGWLMLVAALVIGLAACGPTAGKAEPVDDLLTRFGWSIVGEPVESSDRLPADFALRSGRFPWRVYLDLSGDGGLDFRGLAGQTVKTLRFRVQDTRGDRLWEIGDRYLLWGVALLDQDGKVVGAWLTYTDRLGNFEPGIPGYSLQARSLEQVTGLGWPEYARKHAARE